MTIDGTPFSVSAAKRTRLENAVPAYSDIYTPLMTPIGIAISDPNEVTRRVPTIALAMPPPGSPTGLGIWVKKPTFSDWMPWLTTKNSTNASGTRAMSTDRPQNATNSEETTFRPDGDFMPPTPAPARRPGPSG